MIFEEEQFKKYCYGRKYQDSLSTHIIPYKNLLWAYDKVFNRSMDKWLRKQRFLDAGCAMGHVTAHLIEHGIDCEGYEPSNYAIANVLPSVKDKIVQGDHDAILPTMKDDQYDIVYANSLQYSLDENDIRRWVKETARVCRHSMIFVSVTVQGLSRCISGTDIWKMQIIKPQKWWSRLLYECGFPVTYWITSVMAICLKKEIDDDGL